MMWKLKETIANKQVKYDPATPQILRTCGGVPVKYVNGGTLKVAMDKTKTNNGRSQNEYNKN